MTMYSVRRYGSSVATMCNGLADAEAFREELGATDHIIEKWEKDANGVLVVTPA